MSGQIIIEQHAAVAVLTMNKPERRNALGTESVRALSAALRQCDRNEEINAIVLTGCEPAFCAGSDLKELGGLSVEDMCEHEAVTARVVREIPMLGAPVVAAVEGYALGGGFGLALACDVIISAANVKWKMPEVRNGWLPPWGLIPVIAKVGPARARLLTWGIYEVDGVEAFRLGLVEQLCEPGRARETAIRTAERLAALPRGSARSTKRYFQQFIVPDCERLDAEAGRIFADDARSEASQATLARFAAKA
ncbi:enoyl-CoA hydratase/isomerase family protein [Bradyrhizobium diversitatis]|uniref:Enoyl-CoA hydratase/isomerase family protein n=1 Tax=Bradyrhizobium diversitatis TaxID=2755406 RepID=A0ABS0PFG7_9BRAD|nr:enoyl-CoA hydratase/isomerase family protein [Bradyrhizobium diversitatis]MBH5392054.1 enoyl-CoA hydratase/isomerase family protein [Bradyrhizobium diversitatis]